MMHDGNKFNTYNDPSGLYTRNTSDTSINIPQNHKHNKPIGVKNKEFISSENLKKIRSDINAKQDKLKSFLNVSASNWVSDDTYENYSYKCVLTCNGITDSSVVMVIFDIDEVISGNYLPICTTGTNTVTIYSKVDTSITIPTIKEI